MTSDQLTPLGVRKDRPRYEPLLQERIMMGRLYGDHLSHLQEATPQAVLLFQRLLRYDAALARHRRYDRDLFRLVIPAEDARMHQPPQRPRDHQRAPCTLCLHAALQLDVDAVLTAGSRAAR